MQLVRRLLGYARQGAALVSPLGWTVLAVGFASWIAGAWWGWQELLVVAATSLVLFVIAVGFTVGRLDLDARIGVEPPRVVVGERAAGELAVTNRRTRSARNLRLELPVGKALAVFSEPHLKGEATTDELFVVPTSRRAIIPVGPLTTVQGDPLGLLRRVQVWTDVEEIYVHPKTTVLSTIAAGLIRDMEGQTTNALSPSDVAFHTLREYVRGDDLRHVHWKSSAKIGTLMMRQYNDTRRSHVAVLLSVDPDEYESEDEFELGVSCAASVAVQALRDDQTLTVIAGGQQFPAVNPTKLLDRFSGIEAVPGVGGIETALQLARRVAPDASVAVLCIGSRLGVPEIRRATSRVALEMSNVVLRSALDSDSGYRVVGTSKFVNVPALDGLNRGLMAVIG
jgi:uncharacterized protein (DUF58 family)